MNMQPIPAGIKRLLIEIRLSKVLPGEDSNPHNKNQNLECYHYTTGNYSIPVIV